MNYLTEDATTLLQLTGLNLVEVDRPILTYDKIKKQIIFTFIGRNSSNKNFVIEMSIKSTDLYRAEKINVYTPQQTVTQPMLLAPLSITAIAGEEFVLPIAGDIPETYTSSGAYSDNRQVVGDKLEKYESFSSDSKYLEFLQEISKTV